MGRRQRRSGVRRVMAFLKFGAASAIGFALDLALALVLHEALLLPLWLAATISFFTIAVLNYLLFEFWVFRDARRDASLQRAFGVLVASSIAAVARIATIVLLDGAVTALLGSGRAHDVVLLIAGAGVSLVVNFLINRTVVFRRQVDDSRGAS